MDAFFIAKAREFARAAHGAQERKYTRQPYFTHLEEVATQVEQAGLPTNAIVAAWLHDTVEDTSVTIKQIADEFGVAIAGMVQDLTDTPPGPGLNREKRTAIDRARLAGASDLTQSVKCADLISNTSSIVCYDPGFAKVYLPEKGRILEVLTGADAGLFSKAQASLLAAEMHLPYALEEDRIFKALESFFGTSVHGWPAIPRRRARWWQFAERKVDAKVDAALASVGRGPFTEEMIKSFWEQVFVGQIYEDAGGYVWRCWCAALNLPFIDARRTYDNRSIGMMKSVAA